MGEPKTVITVATKDQVETITREQLPAALADPESRVWIDLENTGTGGFDQLQPALAGVEQILGAELSLPDELSLSHAVQAGDAIECGHVTPPIDCRNAE